MFKNKRIDTRRMAKFIPLTKKGKKVSGVERCPQCDTCPECASSFFDNAGRYIRLIAKEVRQRYGDSLNASDVGKLLEGETVSVRNRTLLKPYAEDLGIIAAAAWKHNHPIPYFEYVCAVVKSRGFEVRRDLEKLLPWNMDDYFFDYIDEKKFEKRMQEMERRQAPRSS